MFYQVLKTSKMPLLVGAFIIAAAAATGYGQTGDIGQQCTTCDGSKTATWTADENVTAEGSFMGSGYTVTARVHCSASVAGSVYGQMCPYHDPSHPLEIIPKTDVSIKCGASYTCSATITNIATAGYRFFSFTGAAGAVYSVSSVLSSTITGSLPDSQNPWVGTTQFSQHVACEALKISAGNYCLDQDNQPAGTSTPFPPNPTPAKGLRPALQAMMVKAKQAVLNELRSLRPLAPTKPPLCNSYRDGKCG